MIFFSIKCPTAIFTYNKLWAEGHRDMLPHLSSPPRGAQTPQAPPGRRNVAVV